MPDVPTDDQNTVKLAQKLLRGFVARKHAARQRTARTLVGHGLTAATSM